MVLNDEFPAIRRRLPSIIDGPFYKGVSALNTSSVDIKIIALCKEKDRMQLCRDLNREVFLLFKKHNIGIPFPQITVSYLKDEEPLSFTEKDKNETEKDNNDVQTFV